MSERDDVPALKPCPFCGGVAERYTIGDDETNNAGGDVISCAVCGASSPVEFGRKENLVSNWNRRAARPAPNAAVREATGPFVDPLVDLDDAIVAGWRCGDETLVGDALTDGEQPTVGDLRRLRSAVFGRPSHAADVLMEAPWGETVTVDLRLASEIRRLWSEGVRTVASSCGPAPFIRVAPWSVNLMYGLGYRQADDPQEECPERDFRPKSVGSWCGGPQTEAYRAGEAAVRERCAVVAETQELYPDTRTGYRQQWVKKRIAERIRGGEGEVT